MIPIIVAALLTAQNARLIQAQGENDRKDKEFKAVIERIRKAAYNVSDGYITEEQRCSDVPGSKRLIELGYRLKEKSEEHCAVSWDWTDICNKYTVHVCEISWVQK